MKLKYVNSAGTEAVFDGDMKAFTERGELFDWDYERLMFGMHLAAITRSGKTFDIVVTVRGSSKDEAAEKANAIFDAMAKDMEPLAEGRLCVDGWYLPCTLAGSKHEFSHSGCAYRFTLTFWSDRPFWVRERPQSFVVEEELDGLDYPHDYHHDYCAAWYSGNLLNASPRPCNIKIVVEGPIGAGWSVRIGANTYTCTGGLDPGARMVVDGREGTIQVIDALGNASSAWSRRAGVFKEGSGSYIFEKVPSGSTPLSWDGCNAVEVTVYEERDEFLWGAT